MTVPRTVIATPVTPVLQTRLGDRAYRFRQQASSRSVRQGFIGLWLRECVAAKITQVHLVGNLRRAAQEGQPLYGQGSGTVFAEKEECHIRTSRELVDELRRAR